MKTAFKAIAAIVLCVAIGVVAFYFGFCYAVGMVFRERVASETLYRVEILRRFNTGLAEAPRKMLETELACTVQSLDAALNRKWMPFLDRGTVLDIRDRAVVYFHTFPPSWRIADSTGRIIEQFAASPVDRDLGLSQSLQPFHQQAIATDATLERLLREFDPAKLDPGNRRFLDQLTAESKKP